ncbi:glutamine synthetase [Rhodoglobus vestalii]|uniref:glutamine synthetase n=1 Tax=Rhodoglobus vestalii TaxID=193384 RepID=A0A8H2K2Z6_9MICO|nr:glutamine synthetase family protein [Rhodoglobus vestalii]TQO19170.1 glutamine synthetase [Rhodoglobus vestalii]
MTLDIPALQADLQAKGIDVLRLIFPDVLGITRSKDLLVSQLHHTKSPMFCQGVWVTTTGGDVLDGNHIMSSGLPDLLTQIDPNTLAMMPWEPGVAMVVADAFNPDHSISEIAPRSVLQSVIAQYTALGLTPIIGPELEFYIANYDEEKGWSRSLSRTGRVYTTGESVDPGGQFLNLMRMLDGMDIGVFAGNHEFSPSQYEINLWHSGALDAADRTFLFKTAVRDIVARTGKHALFTGKPWGDEGGSGFHLHFSVVDEQGNNIMSDGGQGLSETADHMIAGLLENAGAIAALSNPTVNAYKRLGPDTLAPYRANWGHDNRSAMLRVPPERGAGTRLEMRLGDPAANPYLLIASTLAAGLDGITRSLAAPAPVEGWAYEDESAPILPMSLAAALDALDADTVMRNAMGSTVIEVFSVLKRDEVKRYEDSVTDKDTREVSQWEIDEYFADY